MAYDHTAANRLYRELTALEDARYRLATDQDRAENEKLQNLVKRKLQLLGSPYSGRTLGE